ncbi:MAG: S1C family serine protease [Actinomycetota bacterium]|nr:S1C family serine protease [Actinomycetota bacterium]
MGALAEVEAAVAEITSSIGPAVVGIGGGWAQGCGVVVGDGLVLTNAHNVRGDEVQVSFGADKVVSGHLAGVDVDGDLAVVSVDTAGVEPIGWPDTANAISIRPGRVVFALANPGGRGLRVTAGLISSVGRSFRGPRGRRVTGSVEHTAPMGRGSSGGPIVDATGTFVGLNTNRMGEGFYLAIPADAEFRMRVDALAHGDNPTRRHLGVGLIPGRAARRLRRSVGLPDREGVLVQVVEDDSPAARAGLRRGDLIVEATGRAITSIDDLYQAVDALGDGDSMALGVVRGNEELAVSVTFGATGEEGSASVTG